MENPITSSFIFLFERDLDKLASEIERYPDDDTLWKTAGDITNPAGNLCLHLCGNLQHYISVRLGASEYQRNRPLEFSAKGLTKAELLSEIRTTKDSILNTLRQLDDVSLYDHYPEEVLGYPMTTVFFLNHLFGHFGYHLGQINYHRRIIATAQ